MTSERAKRAEIAAEVDRYDDIVARLAARRSPCMSLRDPGPLVLSALTATGILGHHILRDGWVECRWTIVPARLLPPRRHLEDRRLDGERQLRIRIARVLLGLGQVATGDLICAIMSAMDRRTCPSAWKDPQPAVPSLAFLDPRAATDEDLRAIAVAALARREQSK
jgi:hypothetical protein